MSQGSLSIPNESGAAFRADVNTNLQALGTLQSGATAPTTTYAYMLWADTTNSLLKQRDGSNASWIVIGTLGTANWGLATLASPSFTGTATFSGDIQLTGTGQLDLPAGTTAQRSGSPIAGMVRFNTTLTQFEGYNGSAWGAIGGGATGGGSDRVFYENGQTITTNYTLSSSTNAVSAGPVSINSGITVTIPTGQNWVIV